MIQQGNDTQNLQWELRSGSVVYYDVGNFDEWCVYVQDTDGNRHAPRDEKYFQVLSDIAGRHVNGRTRIYLLYLCIYYSTNSVVGKHVLRRIQDWTQDYGDDADTLEEALVTIYFAMVAEENKRPEYRWPLKKRVKKIGVRQLLIGNATPQDAANGTRNVPWRESVALLEAYEAQDEALFGRINWDVLPQYEIR